MDILSPDRSLFNFCKALVISMVHLDVSYDMHLPRHQCPTLSPSPIIHIGAGGGQLASGFPIQEPVWFEISYEKRRIFNGRHKITIQYFPYNM